MNDIKLSVGMEVGDAISAAEQLQKQIEDIFSANAGKNVSAQFQQIQIQMSRLYDKSVELKTLIDANRGSFVINPEYEKVAKSAEELTKKITALSEKNAELERRMGDEKILQVTTEEYRKLGEELDKLDAQYGKVREREKRFLEVHKNNRNAKNLPSYQGIIYDLNELAKKFDEIVEKRDKMREDGTAYTNTKEYGRLVEEHKKLNDVVRETVEQWTAAVNAKREYEKSGTDKTAWEKTETGKKAIND